jgi:hypothetical protein
LSQEYREQEESRGKNLFRNEAIPWARQAVEIVLMLDRNSFSQSNQNDDDDEVDQQEEKEEFQMKMPGATTNNTKKEKKSSSRKRFLIEEKDPDGGLILEALRTVSLISELVSRTSVVIMETIAQVSLECLFTLATTHFLPSVRLNALICLSSILKFGETRRAVLFSSSNASSSSSNFLQWADKLTTALFLAGIGKLAKEDPDSGVRFVAKDFGEMLMM